jgi:hypothetical protein
MRKLAVILPAAGAAALLALGGCATRDDVAAVRSDIAAWRASDAAAGPDLKALRADIAGLRAEVGAAATTRGVSPDLRALRVDIASLRAALEYSGAPTKTGEIAAPQGPPPAGYQKVSTLVRLPEFIPGLGTLYVQPQTLPAGPFLAYDRDNRLVSTIYMIPVADLTAQKRFEHLSVGAPAVQDTDFYHNPGHPGVETPHYHVVLWHVPEASAKLD